MINREKLKSLFVALQTDALDDSEKRKFRRALNLIERRNSRTLAHSWHCVRVNRGCLSFGTIYTYSTCSSCEEARKRAENLFSEPIISIHTRKVKAGIAVRVDIYAPFKKNGGNNA